MGEEKVEVKSLKQRVEELENSVRPAPLKGGSKPFNIGYFKRAKGASAHKRGKILVFKMTKGKTLSIDYCPFVNGLLLMDGAYKDVSVKHVFLYNGKIPCVIIPSWRNTPLADDELGSEDHAAVQETMIKALKASEVVEEKKGGLSGKAWIFIGVALIIVMYVLFGGGLGGAGVG